MVLIYAFLYKEHIHMYDVMRGIRNLHHSQNLTAILGISVRFFWDLIQENEWNIGINKIW